MTCHIEGCGYPKGECAGTCGSFRKVKPYPHTVDDLPLIDFAPDEYRRDGLRTMAVYGLFAALLLVLVFVFALAAGYWSSK
jgi:hypothetical protein